MTAGVISVREVRDELDRAEALVLDVRESDEVAQGAVPGAANIPLRDLPERLAELDPGRPVWVVCRSGNRSGQAAALLDQHGFDARNMTGGMLAWTAAGYRTDPL